ncbi:MAG: hypothetical protein ACRDIY_00885 [Chloroflexota bacterium]
MNWRTGLAIVGTVAAFAWLGVKLYQDPDARDSVIWALRSWIRPPDADAAWQQGPG